MQANTINHYKLASDVYHDSWFHRCGSPYEKWQTALIHNSCDSIMKTKTVLIADIGGGTGRCGSLLHDAAGLTRNVLCVDPSADMLAIAKQRSCVDVLEQDCIGFASSLQSQSFDIFILKEMIHCLCIEAIGDMFANLHRGLRQNGLCLVVTRPSVNIDYPFFEAAKTIWREQQPDAEVYRTSMISAGFQNVTVREHSFPVRMQMSIWISAIANRVWTTFSRDNFSDVELERGIAEIIRSHPADAHGDVHFDERLIFVEGVKY